MDAWPSRDMDGYLQHLLSAVVLWGGASSTRGSVWLSKKCSREIQKYSWEIQGGQPSTRGRLWLSKKDHKAANFSTPDSAIICSDKNDGPRIFLQKSYIFIHIFDSYTLKTQMLGQNYHILQGHILLNENYPFSLWIIGQTKKQLNQDTLSGSIALFVHG